MDIQSRWMGQLHFWEGWVYLELAAARDEMSKEVQKAAIDKKQQIIN